MSIDPVRESPPSKVHCSGTLRRIAGAALIALALCIALLPAGCGRSYPRMETYKAVQLITALRTACSSQNAERLQRAAAAIDEERREGRLSESQHLALRDIVAAAEAGDWKEAEQMCYRFQKAQVRH